MSYWLGSYHRGIAVSTTGSGSSGEFSVQQQLPSLKLTSKAPDISVLGRWSDDPFGAFFRPIFSGAFTLTVSFREVHRYPPKLNRKVCKLETFPGNKNTSRLRMVQTGMVQTLCDHRRPEKNPLFPLQLAGACIEDVGLWTMLRDFLHWMWSRPLVQTWWAFAVVLAKSSNRDGFGQLRVTKPSHIGYV